MPRTARGEHSEATKGELTRMPLFNVCRYHQWTRGKVCKGARIKRAKTAAGITLTEHIVGLGGDF